VVDSLGMSLHRPPLLCAICAMADAKGVLRLDKAADEALLFTAGGASARIRLPLAAGAL
jgi:hypothetical protein